MSSQQDLSYLVDLTGRQYPLEPNKEFTIGRALSNSLTIEDLKISRTHCRLKEFSGLWSVVDESANGIYVNEKRVPRNEPLVLSNGDAVKLTDQVQFRFVEARSAVATDMEMSDIVDQIETEHQYNTTADVKPNVVEVEKPTKAAAMDLGEGSGTNQNSARPDVETELQCSICTELFVKAKTLNCSHTFCAVCIDEWKRKNKVCPICRARIKTITPTIVLDNLVSTVIQSSSDEVKHNRKLLLEERSKVIESAAAKPRGPHTRSRTANATRALVASDPVLISSDNETESDDDDDDLSLHAILSDSDEFVLDDDDDFDGYAAAEYDSPASYVPGDPHAYYGGYGSCFHCGARGHWANGCPFR